MKKIKTFENFKLNDKYVSEKLEKYLKKLNTKFNRFKRNIKKLNNSNLIVEPIWGWTTLMMSVIDIQKEPEILDMYHKLFDYVINLKGIDIDFKDTYNRTALFHACTSVDFYSIKKLLEKGANPNIQNNDGNTALIYAYIIYKYRLSNPTSDIEIDIEDTLKVLIILITYGSDWNIKNKMGNDFLYYLDKDIKDFIINMFPDKYKDYLIKKDMDKYNM